MNHPVVQIYKTTVLPESTNPVEEWRWRLKSGNGEIVATGESYTSERDAERGFRDMVATVLSVLTNALEFGANWKIEVIDAPEDEG